MNRTLMVSAVVLVGVATLVGLSSAGQEVLKSGQKAPAFSAKGSDGKDHSLSSLTAKGPVLLYFIKQGCPVNAEAVAYYNRIADAYKGKATFVGVINQDKAGYENWQKQYKGTYPVLFDPAKRIISSYKAAASPWVIEVKQDGTIGQVWTGYSSKALTELNTLMAKAAKTSVASVDLKGAPTSLTYG